MPPFRNGGRGRGDRGTDRNTTRAIAPPLAQRISPSCVFRPQAHVACDCWHAATSGALEWLRNGVRRGLARLCWPGRGAVPRRAATGVGLRVCIAPCTAHSQQLAAWPCVQQHCLTGFDLTTPARTPQTRFCTKYRHSDGVLVLKVTDDVRVSVPACWWQCCRRNPQSPRLLMASCV